MKKYTQFIAENKSRTFDPRYYYAVYTDSRLKEITGPYKSEDSAWYDHGGDMDEIHKGDEIQNLMNRGKYKEYTLRLADKPI